MWSRTCSKRSPRCCVSSLMARDYTYTNQAATSIPKHDATTNKYRFYVSSNISSDALKVASPQSHHNPQSALHALPPPDALPSPDVTALIQASSLPSPAINATQSSQFRVYQAALLTHRLRWVFTGRLQLTHSPQLRTLRASLLQARPRFTIPFHPLKSGRSHTALCPHRLMFLPPCDLDIPPHRATTPPCRHEP